ncbi:PEP-CTERM sorting domain-containing protein [Gloeothece citriformis]|uniref:PEP-CTERM sorting domain-containing protein n=1 Tax=Gloeothece citriformis TaxID=2546356 RepID=UPI0002F43391
MSNRILFLQLYSRASGNFSPLFLYLFYLAIVREPMTLLGVGIALGFGAAFKRKNAKKENKG